MLHAMVRQTQYCWQDTVFCL